MKKTGNISVRAAKKLFGCKDIGSIDLRAAEKMGFDKKANADVSYTDTTFFSPRLTQESWMLPRSRKMLLKWVKIYADWDPYISSILRMHARYPISEFNVVTQNDAQRELFEAVFHQDSFEIMDALRESATSFYRYGEACLSGDTKIKLLNGKDVSIKELYDQNETDFWVYSIDGNKNIVPGKAHKVLKTRENAELLKITLDNGESFKCTPDHLIMMRDGSYKEAKDLKEQDSLMPLYTHEDYIYYKSKPSVGKYKRVYNPSTQKNPFLHRVIAEFIYGVEKIKGMIVHHKDYNALNNNPENLEIMTKGDHRKHHLRMYTEEQIEHFRQKTKDLYKQPGYAERMGQLISEGLNDPIVISKISKSSKENWDKHPERKEQLSIKMKKKWEDEEYRKTQVEMGKERGKQGLTHIQQLQSERNKNKYDENGNYRNHKVLSIEKVQNEDVYDIQCVDKFHNFAIGFNDGSGIFVHNCGLSEWNSEYGIWTGTTILDPALIEVEEVPFTNKIKIYAEIPKKIEKLWKSKDDDYKEDRERIPPEVVNILKQGGKYIELDTEESGSGKNYDPARCFMLTNKTDIGEDGLRGMPPITSLLRACVFEDFLRKAQFERAKRFAYPIEFWKLGDTNKDIFPSDQDLKNVRELLRGALAAPPYSIIYSPLLSLQVIGAEGSMLNITEDLNYVENQKLVGLGTNKNIILGEGSWLGASKTISLQRLIMDYEVDRSMWTRKLLQNHYMRALCMRHGYVKKSPITKLIIPDIPGINWHKELDLQNAADIKKQYKDDWKDGLISTKTYYTKYPELNYEDERKALEEEVGSVFDSGVRKLKAPVPKVTDGELGKPVKPDAPVKPIKPTKDNGEQVSEQDKDTGKGKGKDEKTTRVVEPELQSPPPRPEKKEK